MRAHRIGSAIALVLLLASGAAFVHVAAERPAEEGWEPKKVQIPKGSTFRETGRILDRAGVLRRPLVFRILVVATMTGRRLQHGEYSFPSPPSAFETWRKLVKGDVTRYSVTIPEGSTIYEIAEMLGSLELADPNEFLRAASSPAVAARLGVPGPALEGYLFPDTYILVKFMPVEEIAGIMVREFRQKITPAMEERARRDGLTLGQVVTMASIIEKETGIPEEKPIVSAVIRRRLALGMPLQMDPTVIYGLRKFGGNLTRKDLAARHPYNTYVYRGLPPGPIANPGLGSLKAALEPADTKYLYFVSRNDGSHAFSANLADHNRAVATFQRGGSGAPDGPPTLPPPRRGPS